ncbi:hypothetical protein LTR75_013866 [Friedmanniomyces endolithicus]|nr:hypothetical protein LTR75_013866 [Friedmanniomyces endolithicus]
MRELATYQIRQAPSPLPPSPSSDVLTAEHWGILSAIADTVVPSYAPLAGNRLLQHPLRGEVYQASCKRLEHGIGLPDANVLATSYLAEGAFAQEEFKDGLTRLINLQLHEEARKQLIFILDALGSFTTLVKVLWVRTSPTLGLVLNYPRTPVHQNAPGTSYPFTFLQIPPSTDNVPEVLEADVVVVGSGCGGAVAAKTFAEAGMKVIVVDKSYYWPPEHLPMSEHEGFAHLFANGGALQSDDSTMAIVAGSAWGGGGTASSVENGRTNSVFTHFTSAAYQADLDAVCDRMGVGTAAIEHNKTNQVLLDGARKLGWNAKAVPQNTGGKAHNCGYCTLGCGSSGKQGPAETFLPDAGRAGATFIEGFDVEEVLFENSTGLGDKRAVGIKGVWMSRDSSGGVAGTDRSSRQVIIEAPKVIVSCGSLYTPVLLRRSGLTNPHIGRHLHMHPVCLVGAVWDEDTMPWEGSILTTVINEFENLDGEGYGVKLEANCMLPGFFLPLFPWRSGLEFKEFAAKMKRMTGYISLARDRYGGRVYPDPVDSSQARIQYAPSKHDKAHILEGMVHLAELLYVEGAKEIFTSIPSTPSFVRPFADPEAKVQVTGIHAPSINDAEFQAWLTKLRRAGLPSPDTGFASAHQMGSCRMGTSPHNSAVDPNGRVWGTQGLYVCDASVFPSASGVNPMVTNMAISRGVARHIVEREGVSPSTAARSRL